MTLIPAPSRQLLPARRLGTPPPNATLATRVDLSPTMAIFTIVPDDGVPAFVPGQYFALGLLDGQRVVQRPYSAASAAADGVLEFVLRLVPGGTLTPRLWRLRVGDRLRVGPPRGLFRLAEGDRRTHLLLATGTGIAPLVAMARELCARREPPPVIILQGAVRADELAFAGRLSSWALAAPGLRRVAAVSRPAEPANAGWRGATGRLDALVPSLLAEADVDPRDAIAYVCGNPDAVASIRQALHDVGVPTDAIRSEPYWGGTALRPA